MIVAIFAAECAVLAGVRIEAGDRETRAAMREIALERAATMRAVSTIGGRVRRRDLLQRNMDRHRHDAKLGGSKHHDG